MRAWEKEDEVPSATADVVVEVVGPKDMACGEGEGVWQPWFARTAALSRNSHHRPFRLLHVTDPSPLSRSACMSRSREATLICTLFPKRHHQIGRAHV